MSVSLNTGVNNVVTLKTTDYGSIIKKHLKTGTIVETLDDGSKIITLGKNHPYAKLDIGQIKVFNWESSPKTVEIVSRKLKLGMGEYSLKDFSKYIQDLKDLAKVNSKLPKVNKFAKMFAKILKFVK